MECGTTFSGTWLDDFGALREAAVMLDEAGVEFVGHGGHVLVAREGRFDRPVATYSVSGRDPFILYTHLAGATKRLRFRTSILILPLFPTALVAKQAADLSIVSGGRFELGVGISWNGPEYVAMGQDLSVRGRRVEEQLALLKRLWTEPLVTFSGEFHEFDEVGLGELPSAPIPIWIGSGDRDRVLRRIAKFADGWMPNVPLTAERISRLSELADEAGRAGAVEVMGRLTARPEDPDGALAEARQLVDAGVTMLSINPPREANLVEGIAAVIANRAHVLAALADS